jgi:hypothetical protein
MIVLCRICTAMVGSPFLIYIHPSSGLRIYPWFITNRKFMDCNYHYNQRNSTYKEFVSYSIRVFVFSSFLATYNPLPLTESSSPADETLFKFCLLTSTRCANYHHFIRAEFQPRLLFVLYCTSFLRLFWNWIEFRCAYGHKLYVTITE